MALRMDARSLVIRFLPGHMPDYCVFGASPTKRFIILLPRFPSPGISSSNFVSVRRLAHGFVDGVDAPPDGIAMCHCGES